MAMSVTVSEKRSQGQSSELTKITFAIVSAANGTASGDTSSRITGQVVRTVFVPGSGGVQPTDQFDIVLNDSDGYDVLHGAGANISNAAAAQTLAAQGYAVGDTLTLSASGMGDTKSATVIVYVKA